MNCLVTGAAGFIGSHLCEKLLRDGHTVRGTDAFIPYYPRSFKEANLAGLGGRPGFEFLEADLRTADVNELTAGIEVVFHLAAMPGLPRSWTDFDLYEGCNVTATQRLLASLQSSQSLKRFVYASTSSVYGRYASGDETMPTRPISPYGVTKLAAENLCRAYAEEQELPLVVLRYFSVYGPRQRPDMGYQKFVTALLRGEPIVVFGDGQQARGNTYIADCVEATALAAGATPGETYNVGGGESVALWEVIRKLESLTGCKAMIERKPPRAGDQRSTFADTGKLLRHLGWSPKVGIDEGLERQVAWQKKVLATAKAA
ncbi:MAG: NAD-dependent epimerase/dehydratase family protein [Gemmataceae bacterium]